MDRIDPELDNIRVALAWTRDQGEHELLQRITGNLRMYWQLRSMYREGREWLDRAHALTSLDPLVKFKVLDGLTSLAYRQGEAALALELAEESLPLAAATGDEREMVTAHSNVANALTSLNRHAEAGAHYDAALEIARRLNDPSRLAAALTNRGDWATIVGRYEEAAEYLRLGWDAWREANDTYGASVAQLNLATVSFFLGSTDDAERLAFEGIESMPQAVDGAAVALLIHAGVANRRDNPERAEELLGASASIRASTGYELEPSERRLLEQVREEIGEALDGPEARAAFERGSAMDLAVARGFARRH